MLSHQGYDETRMPGYRQRGQGNANSRGLFSARRWDDGFGAPCGIGMLPAKRGFRVCRPVLKQNSGWLCPFRLN